MTLDHRAIMTSMVGCQEETMLVVGDPGWGGMEQDGPRFHRATQNGAQFKTYKLFISASFRLIFADCS